jgi:hypothetical protein
MQERSAGLKKRMTPAISQVATDNPTKPREQMICFEWTNDEK